MPVPKQELYAARQALAVTPHASTEINPCRALYVGTGGDLVVVLLDSASEITFANVPDGAVLPIQVRRVDDSSTASNILALY